MNGYEIFLKFDESTKLPGLSWQQTEKPDKTEIINKLHGYVFEFNVSESYLKENAIVFIDEVGSSLMQEPEVLELI